jgi:minor histocompatibility antigen H13
MDKKQSSFETNLCYLLIVFFNLLPWVVQVPISFQLFFNSIACIYLGSNRGIVILQSLEKEEKDKIEKMTTKDAYMFPVYGSGVLFGLYVVFKFFDKNILNTILSVHFTFFGFLSLIQLLCYHLEKFFPEWQKVNIIKKKLDIKLPFYQKTLDISVSKSEMIAGIISVIPTIAYFATKHWLLNNLFGVAFSICGIESLVLPNFQVGFILLWGLFFYDIFWVYGTDVMLTVAKSVDAPIKLIFPINLQAETPTFSMLGLGDIVIPGVFIALCLKYDVDKAILNLRKQGTKEFNLSKLSRPYFVACLIGYALGIVMTFNAMIIFNHPQPALLFLVPSCCLSVLALAAKNGAIKELFNYDEEKIRLEIEAQGESSKEK